MWQASEDTLGILWAMALLWFVIEFTGEGRLLRGLAFGLTAMLLLALIINLTSPYGLLYAEITDVRRVDLPWGEVISLAEG